MRQLPNAYILMRVFFPEEVSDGFLQRLQGALESVRKNQEDYVKHGGRLFLLINDDTPHSGWTRFREHQLILYSRLLLAKLDPNSWSIIQTNGKGSAYATYNIRQEFLNLTGDDERAIAITLDQDDILREKAAVRIARIMKDRGIVVSPFKIQDDEGLDITDDGGKRHNILSRKLAFFIRPMRISSKQVFVPKLKLTIIRFPRGLFDFFDQLANVGHNIRALLKYLAKRRKNLWAGNRNYSELSSIGWTKAFSRPVLSRYQKDLTAFMNAERGGVDSFFLNHRAYEDFIDFYTLLCPGVKLRGTLHRTHTYVKHKGSITSSPSIDDFRNHRTASLIALIDICYTNKNNLRPDFEFKLFRFVASKVYQIDLIISKHRNDFTHKGVNSYDEFAAQTHEGYFISKICRLALGEIRPGSSQDIDLFKYPTGRGPNSKQNFEALFSASHLSAIPEYHSKASNATPRFVLRKAVSIEKSLVHKESKHKNDDDVAKLYGNNTPPQKKRLTFIGINILCWVAIAAGAVLYVSIDKSFKISDSQTLAAAVISVWLGILTYLLTERGKVKTLADEEASMQKLYYSEFTDFTRHLEANLKVMIQIRRQLIEKPSKRQVESIHFINLKWPESSCLFSDSMAKIISKDRVDDFARLRVNLRNINNSGDWLHSIDTSKTDILPDLEWEITRHIGYLLNMYYLAKNNFSFASQNELDMFVHENSIKNQLTGLFMDYTAKERSEQIRFFIEKYYDDRRMKRAVLIH